MQGHTHRFVPAAGHDWLLPFYDPVQRLLGGPAARRELLDQAGLVPGKRVLEIGCGTGDLVVLAKRLHPEVEVVGLDPDPRALARAAGKASREGLAVQLDAGYSQELPYADASFDAVFSSFMLHHLEPEVKALTLREVHRVLRVGGSFHLMDFGGSADRRDGLVARLLHRADAVGQGYGGRIPALLEEAGLAEVRARGERGSPLGRIARYSALRPDRDGEGRRPGDTGAAGAPTSA